MKNLSLTLPLAMFAAGAFAQATAPAAPNTESYTPAAASAIEARTTKDLLTSRNCVRDTGSHIVRKGTDTCINTTGRSYDKANIDQTGATGTGKALLQLDPSINLR
jgi:hypothetical protein